MRFFRDRITLRLELSGGSKIRDPVPAKFKHVTNIVTCTFCSVVITSRTVCAGTVKFKKKADYRALTPPFRLKNTPLVSQT